MSEFAHLDVIPDQILTERRESGLLVPFQGGEVASLQVIDCGDVRPLTDAVAEERRSIYGDVVPARYFGGKTGLATTAMATIMTEHGSLAVTELIDHYGSDAIATFAADLGDRANNVPGMPAMHDHSDTVSEGNSRKLAHEHNKDDPLGCKFATFLGIVVMNSASPEALEETKRIRSITGEDLPIESVHESLVELTNIIPADTSISRAAMHRNVHQRGGHFAVLEHVEIPSEQVGVVIDLAGYRSDARRHLESGNPRFHHSVGVAELLRPLLPEMDLDPKVLRASGLLIGVGTRMTLPNRPKAELIPAEMSAAA